MHFQFENHTEKGEKTALIWEHHRINALIQLLDKHTTLSVHFNVEISKLYTRYRPSN